MTPALSPAQCIIDYLRYRSGTSASAILSPEDCHELVHYIDQLRAINQTFAMEITVPAQAERA
jgi:hypothetical protein